MVEVLLLHPPTEQRVRKTRGLSIIGIKSTFEHTPCVQKFSPLDRTVRVFFPPTSGKTPGQRTNKQINQVTKLFGSVCPPDGEGATNLLTFFSSIASVSF